MRKTAYDLDELLSYENQKLIAQTCGGSIHKVNALLTCGNRALLPKPLLETSYYFSGPAGSVKSLFVSCFMRLCGNHAVACELADIKKGFSRAELLPKKLLVLNEFIQMKDQNEKFIKSFIGRDSQSYEIKYVQGHKSGVFKGIIIIVSNLGPHLTYGSSAAMHDRFIPIEFSPRLGEANPNLSKQLEDNESGFVNLLMNIDPDIFPHLTRAGLFNKEITYETNFLVPFILNKLFFLTRFLYIFDCFEWRI
jgi:phage/plasmid-associated DNA primase